MMNDYFFEMCDARAQCAGARIVIENLLMAIEKGENNPILLKAAINCAKDEVASITALLEAKQSA